ncbi:MAG TPA: protein kinase [Gemmatimonadales bacterium]|nr:protein kinase [Gemmatimonadales bacterium]
MPDLSPGARFGVYRLIRPLGKGGFAEVWEAENEGNGRRVALKVLTELRAESARALERFQQEGRIAASLASPRCVYVFDAGTHDGFPYITMELVAGGTLGDRIAHGPLDARAAVDIVLDVLDGLESAQQAGILHRDVKPSNVFLDAGGRAKIGDFGISKSLEVDSHLSQTGAFLGTPYYASPEQIAAEPLDLRSDLYSVGAMLYELVTGKLPYQGTNASAVLAQVLTREPVPFAQHDVAVPPGLQRVILRLLAKSKEKRFQSYAQLRAALLPLSSRGLAPAGLARRFGAIVVDGLLFMPLGVALGTRSLAQGGQAALAPGVVAALEFVYFTLLERYWGGSIGKRLFGLRVTGADGTAPTLGRVAWRTALYLLITSGASLLVQVLAGGELALAARPVLRYVPNVLRLLGSGVLLSTMRRRNGYAGLHEVVSNTRVMELLAGERSGAVPRTAAPVEAAATAEYGPYRTTATVWRDGGEALLVARDAELHRDVWIHEFADAAAAPAVERLRSRGEGSLPWLQRGTRDGLTWDAYGAPQGTPLERWAAERGGLGWREMRDVLGALARELESRFARDGTAGPLSPRQVWVESTGRALLLDFPAERASAAPDGAVEEVTPETWRRFVGRVATLGFQHRAVLPEYARPIVAGLRDEQPVASIGEFRTSLEKVAPRPAEVTRARRAGPFAVLGTVAAFVVAFRMAVPALMASLPPWWRDITFNGDTYLAALHRADSAGAAADSATRNTATAVQVVLAAAARDARASPQGTSLVAGLPAPLRTALDSAARRFPAPDSQLVAAARTRLAVLRTEGPQALRGGLAVVPKAVLLAFTALSFVGACGVVLALLLRGGLLFSLFGIGVVRADGVPAGRLRCGARAFVAWSPLLLLLALTALPGGVRVAVQSGTSGAMSVSASQASPPAAPRTTSSSLWLRWALGALALAGAAVAVSRPTRGLAERVCGVVLVPR